MPLVDDAQRDFSIGIVRGVGPQAIDGRAVMDHVNGLYEADGGLFKRGGSIDHSTALSSPSSHPLVWGFDGYFDAGRRTIVASQDNFYVLGTDDATLIDLGSDGLSLPRPSALMESMLFIGGGYIYGGSRKTATYSTGTVSLTKATYDANGVITNETAAKTVTGSGTTFTSNVDAGMLFQRGNERVYVIASVDSNTQLTLRDPYDGATGSGISYTAHHFYKMTTSDPYETSSFYAVCDNRLLRGTGNKVEFTEIRKPHKWTLTAGDPSGEIPNRHEFPEGSQITGLAAIGKTAVVFTSAGVWTIDGMAFDIVDTNGNSNHRVQVLSREIVSYGQTSTWEQALIVPCTSGIFLLDGVSSPRRVSHPLGPLYQLYMDRNYQPGQGTVYKDHYILPFISAGGVVKDILVARLDRPIKVNGQTAFPWARQGGVGVECPAFFVRHSSTAQQSLLLGANFPLAEIVDCSGWFEPDATNMLDADGEPPEWVLVTRDFETGNLTKNTVRTVRPRYEMVGTGAVIEGAYGFGVSSEGGYRWDEWDWADDPDDSDVDNLYWEDEEEDVYYELTCEFGESDGLNPDHCRVDEETRLIRYRFRQRDACSRLRFRSVEHFVRQSAAQRR